MSKLFTLVLLFHVSFIYSFSQQRGNAGRTGQGTQMTGRFYGKVVDAAKKGIEAASVTLIQKKFDTLTKKQQDVIGVWIFKKDIRGI